MTNRETICQQLVSLLVEQGSTTRPQCIDRLGVRAASLLEAIDHLKTLGLLQEPSRVGMRTGRRAPRLEFAPDYFWTVGIDFQEERVLGVVSDLSGVARHSVEIPGRGRDTVEECWRDIHEAMGRLKKACGADWKRVRGIGFADPGLVDMTMGRSIRAVNLAGWRDVPTQRVLEERYGIPTKLWPECAVRTHAEYLQRRGRLEGTLFYIGLGRGVGGGFIRNGECFFGDGNLAMEIGHVVVKPNGPLCQCGNRGCLEAFAGKNGIRRMVEETLRSDVNTSLDLQDFSLEKFVRCVKEDKPAYLIACEVSEYVGRALATVVTLLNPSCIVFGDELTGLGDLLLDTVRRNLEFYCFPGSLKNLSLEISTLPPGETAREAALLVRNDLLKKEFGRLC